MTARRLQFLAVLILGIGAAAARETDAQRELQFENDRVKSWKTIIRPNQPLELHRHDHGRAVIVLKGGTLQVLDEDGNRVDVYQWEDGEAYWLDPDPPGELHGDLNEGPGTMEVIVVELKE